MGVPTPALGGRPRARPRSAGCGRRRRGPATSARSPRRSPAATGAAAPSGACTPSSSRDRSSTTSSGTSPTSARFWCPVPDPERFAAVADAAADAILAADPRATLTLGGLAAFRRTAVNGPGNAQMSSLEFLRRMLAERPGLAGKLDAIGVHAYGARPGRRPRRPRLPAPRGRPRRPRRQAAELQRDGLVHERPRRASRRSTSRRGRATSARSPTPSSARTAASTRSRRIPGSRTSSSRPTSRTGTGSPTPQTGEPYPTAQAYIDRVLLYEGRGDGAPEPGRTLPIC